VQNFCGGNLKEETIGRHEDGWKDNIKIKRWGKK
jgi:hypothetical protein